MNRFLFLFLLAFTLLPSTGWAQRIDQLPNASTSPVAGGVDERVAAVVNDDVISSTDIHARMVLAMMASGLPNTPAVQQRLFPQVLHGLIDEQLQLQEAKRLEISVTKEEIEQALAHAARDNNIQGDMKDYVTQHGGSPDALVQQIRAGLSWSKVVQRELRPRVDIGDDEVEAVLERMRANAGKDEYLVSEIFLAVDTPKDEDQVKQFADNLVQQLKTGANFGAVAREFSQGTGAATGGDIGWIQEGQLPTELGHALTSMQAGQVKGPLRSASGYHILGLREKRTLSLGNEGDVTLGLQQAFRPFDAATDKDSLLKEAAQIKSTVTSCTNLQGKLATSFPTWHWQDLGDVKPAKLPAPLLEKVSTLSVGGASEPLATDKGALILFLCAKHVPVGGVNRDAIMNSIGSEKLELQARRLQRDLRRAAYIDIRLMSAP